jgi:hypothetical protein
MGRFDIHAELVPLNEAVAAAYAVLAHEKKRHPQADVLTRDLVLALGALKTIYTEDVEEVRPCSFGELQTRCGPKPDINGLLIRRVDLLDALETLDATWRPRGSDES